MTDPPGPRVVERLRSAGCVFAEEEAALLVAEATDDPAALERLTRARESGLPLEQVLGWAELAGVRVAVAPGVFVPRRRTELMVRTAVALAGAVDPDRPVVLLDLCCGSGAVAVAVAAALGRAGRAVEVTAADLDPAAVACARANLPDARVLTSDLFADLPTDLRGRVDVVCANVPYVPTDDLALLPREAREHEPALALDGGPDGLALLRRVAAEAPRWLAPTGALLLEVAQDQLPDALAALAAAGLDAATAADDDLGAQVVVGRARPDSSTGPRR